MSGDRGTIPIPRVPLEQQFAALLGAFGLEPDDVIGMRFHDQHYVTFEMATGVNSTVTYQLRCVGKTGPRSE